MERLPEPLNRRRTSCGSEKTVKQVGGRAPRFALDVPLRYRPIGATAWQEGRTENISRSGVLFLADRVMEVDTRIEMTFVLPVTGLSGQVVCRGRVVRIVQPREDEPPIGRHVSGIAVRRITV